MFSCFGVRQRRPHDREPLVPRHRDDDTALQRELHRKLHSYQMLRALTKGYMPSNDQVVINLRTVLAADALHPDNPDLSDPGRLLVKYTKQWLQQLIDLLQHKNSEDQIQDLIWYLSKSRISVDVDDARHRLRKAKRKAETSAAYRSLQTAGTLLLTNSDFRLFLSDLNVVAREVFKDTAFTLSGVAEEAGKQLEPSQKEQQKLKGPGADEGSQPSNEELASEVAEVSQVVTDGAVKIANTAEESLAEKLSGDEKETLLHRLKQAVLTLRQRRDYSDSVSTLSLLLKRYAQAYSKVAEEVLQTAREDVNENPEADRALKNFYALARSFGDPREWDELERRFHNVMKHSKGDPQFESLMSDLGNFLQKLLTDPEFFDHADATFQELRQKSHQVGRDTPIRRDVDAFLSQCQKTLQSTVNDKDITLLLKTTKQILDILSPIGSYANSDLVQDATRVFVPLLIAAIQHIPIPRLEISTPDLDLLLENLIIEPGRTLNNTSFLPYKLRIETYNDVEIRKARFRTTSSLTSRLSLKIDGLSARADDVGFWLRAHSGLFRLADEGIASCRLDERGVDIHIDVDIGRDRLEKVVGLKAVRVRVHRLDYVVRKSSRLRWLGWLVKPLLRPILRKVVEKKVAEAIADAIHAVNREVVFARERLRATRICGPDDLGTFVKAIMARLTPQADPDLYVRVGVEQPGKGVFKGVYAPGSVVKLWNEEAVRASERIEDDGMDGWRNGIFDVHSS